MSITSYLHNLGCFFLVFFKQQMVQLNGKHSHHGNVVPLNVDGVKQVAMMECSDMRQRLPSSFD